MEKYLQVRVYDVAMLSRDPLRHVVFSTFSIKDDGEYTVLMACGIRTTSAFTWRAHAGATCLFCMSRSLICPGPRKARYAPTPIRKGAH